MYGWGGGGGQKVVIDPMYEMLPEIIQGFITSQEGKTVLICSYLTDNYITVKKKEARWTIFLLPCITLKGRNTLVTGTTSV